MEDIEVSDEFERAKKESPEIFDIVERFTNDFDILLRRTLVEGVEKSKSKDTRLVFFSEIATQISRILAIFFREGLANGKTDMAKRLLVETIESTFDSFEEKMEGKLENQKPQRAMTEEEIAKHLQAKFEDALKQLRLHVATILLQGTELFEVPGDAIEAHLEHALNVAQMLIEKNSDFAIK